MENRKRDKMYDTPLLGLDEVKNQEFLGNNSWGFSL